MKGCDCSQGQDVFMVLSGEAEGRQSLLAAQLHAEGVSSTESPLQGVGDIWAPEIWEISTNI